MKKDFHLYLSEPIKNFNYNKFNKKNLIMMNLTL